MTATGSLPLAIVVPTLNAEAHLEVTLAALEPAIRLGADVVVVDGGSTDGTTTIVRDHGLRLLTAAGSMYAALNVGFRSTDEPWLTWINADDLIFCDLLQSRIKAAGAADISYGRVDFIDSQGRFIHSWLSASPKALGTLFQSGYSPILQQGTLFRRSVFERLQGFDERYRFVGDADFWWRADEAGLKFIRSSHPPVGAFRIHSAQLSSAHAREMQSEHRQMVAAHSGRWRPSVLGPLTRWRLENLGAYSVRWLRHVQLAGKARLASSYDVPRYDR